jgi:hypothetical protein
MDYGRISLPKNHLPRIELFDSNTLGKHIVAETIGLRGQTPCRIFGAGKVRTFLLPLFFLLFLYHFCRNVMISIFYDQPRKDGEVVYRRNICNATAKMHDRIDSQQKRARPIASGVSPHQTSTCTTPIDVCIFWFYRFVSLHHQLLKNK